MLGAVRPTGARRSWWLREALAAEAAASPHLAAAAPPLRGSTTADVVVVGGGYTGLWTAVLAKERDPGRDVMLVDAQRIGWAASGRAGESSQADVGAASASAGWVTGSAGSPGPPTRSTGPASAT